MPPSRRGDGVDRSDDDPFRPNESAERHRPRAARTLPAATLARWLLPARVHRWALSVSVDTPATAYERGEPVPVAIGLRNPLPVPVTVETRSPVPWTWHVDGHRDASHVPEPLPESETRFTLDRGERRRFTRRWQQSFRVSETEWRPADRGEHTIGAGIAVDDPEGKGVYDETTVRIE
ncbi:hypothetical protein [Halorubrum yunnanense]|uniref:DUF7974 domain-containing protein n=1 Tax=Halorubrum yunnanense TaxID=1526162 RepID=A0ABD5YCY5_9EURY|nr:hypothetical protein [Halorubrum yunnanense]